MAKDSDQVLGEFEKTDELRLAPASPTPSVTPAPAASTSSNPAFDQSIKVGVDTIRGGIDTYAAEHSGMLPVAATITKASFSQYVPTWPINPVTSSDMVSGAEPGDFVYTVTSASAYTIAGHLTDGSDYTVTGSGTPSGTPSSSPSPSQSSSPSP